MLFRAVGFVAAVLFLPGPGPDLPSIGWGVMLRSPLCWPVCKKPGWACLPEWALQTELAEGPVPCMLAADFLCLIWNGRLLKEL